ncbi:MAG: SDR family oxidoreductase [Ignavibacteria bacterium]|nr:SDR family oxidoreductase [Ignavibacteria bacterium]
MKLKEKRVVITGGSKGLGRALVLRFATEGAWVATCARSEDELRRLLLELSSRDVRAVVLQCDISDPEQVSQFAWKVLDNFGTIDVLVNNASILGPRIDIVEFTKPTWDRVIDINVHGMFHVTKAFLPAMIRQGSGSIINVSSSVGRAGRAQWGAYAVSKFAMEGFTQTLADEMRHHNIRVNSVNPGAMKTDMRHQAYPAEDRSKLRSPEEVTDVFVYLASNESRGITGQYLEAQQSEKTLTDIL